MSSLVATTLQRLHDDGEITPADVARLVSSTRRTIERWKSGQAAPSPEKKELLLYLEAAVKQARRHMGREQAWAWLHSPNPFLDNAIPLDVLPTDYRRVFDALEAEAEGVYV